jgi:Rab-GTPase-TBC domain
MYAFQWYSTVFTAEVLPFEYVLRIWDMFLLDGTFSFPMSACSSIRRTCSLSLSLSLSLFLHTPTCNAPALTHTLSLSRTTLPSSAHLSSIGNKFLLRVSLALLKLHQDELTGLSFENLLPRLKSFQAINCSPDDLIKTAVELHVSTRKLEKIEKEYDASTASVK